MTKSLINILLISSFSCTSYGAVCDIPTQIKLSQPSPCDGYVMNSDAEEKIRADLSYKDFMIGNLQQQTTLQQSIIDNDNKQIDLLKDQAATSNLERVLYFGAGVLLTALVVREVK